MEKKKSEFDKVFSAWDILVIAFGAMIGWGWVVSTGDWWNFSAKFRHSLRWKLVP